MGGVFRAGVAQRTYRGGSQKGALFLGGQLVWAIPTAKIAQIYIDETDAPLGDISSMTARGTWAQAFSNIAFAGGSINAMEADGIKMNGNILRGSMTQGPFGKITVLCDVTLTGTALATQGDLIAINPAGATPTRVRLTYGTSFYRGIVPDNASNDFWIAPLNVRTTVGIEVDLVNGVSKLIGGDGEEAVVASLAASPTSITRIELFKACIGKCHSLSIITEAP